MATNNLAPKSASTQSKDVNMLLRDAAMARPEYQEITKFLGNNTPEAQYGYLSPGVKGEYSSNSFYGNTLPKQGRIIINGEFLDPRFAKDAAVPTLTHEMVHATTGPLAKLYYDNFRNPLTPHMKQFIDAYERMQFNPNAQGLDRNPMSATASKIAGSKWFNDNRGYRSSETELPAFAIGNSMRSDPSNAPPHLDPTLATEYRILLDLATRAQDSLRK